MKQEEIKKQQQDNLNEHLVREKEIEINSIKLRCEQQVRKLEREIKYFRNMNN